MVCLRLSFQGREAHASLGFQRYTIIYIEAMSVEVFIYLYLLAYSISNGWRGSLRVFPALKLFSKL